MTLQEIQVKDMQILRAQKLNASEICQNIDNCPTFRQLFIFLRKCKFWNLGQLTYTVIDLIVLVDSECFGCDFIVNSDKLWVCILPGKILGHLGNVLW